MAKQKQARRLAENEAKAVLNRVRTSPRKLNLVAQVIRGLPVQQALVQLEFLQKRMSGDVKKLLESAIANAENNHNMDVDSLIVKEAYVGKSIVMKRFAARGRGRSARVEKPFSNITIVVKEALLEEVA